MPSPQPRNPRQQSKAKTKPKAAPPKPGQGFLGWLGRQVGHVKHAVTADVTKPAPKTAQPKPKPQSAPDPEVLYRNDKVEEIDHPTEPGLKLRRTTIDEVIADKPTPPQPSPPAQGQ